MDRKKLVDVLSTVRPDIADPVTAIADGRVFVDGSPVRNPRSMVSAAASIVVREPTELRGSRKLRAALEGFGVGPSGRICLDVGAAAGGFTAVLLERSADKVYAVDAGHGQLLGSLRQDARVVNLEATNVADLDQVLVPDEVSLVTIDVSYLALGEAVAQLDRVTLTRGSELVGLVKPMFELRLATAPTDEASLADATSEAVAVIEGSGWVVEATMPSPVTGARGAIEGFVHARRIG